MNEANEVFKNTVKNYCQQKKKWGGFKKSHPQTYEWVIEKTSFLDNEALPSQRLWHIVNDVYEIPSCQNQICAKPTKWHQGKYRNYCSTQCSCKSKTANEKRNKSLLTKYGVKTFGKIRENDDVRRKVKETNEQKYGHSYYVESNDFKKKNVKTLRERYGVDHYSKTEEYKKKNRKTLLEKYEVEHNLSIPEVKEKRETTWNEKYGGNPLSSSLVRKKITKTNLERYGYKNPTQNDEIKQKIIDTSLKRYNRNNPSQNILSDDAFEKLENKEWLREQRDRGLSFGTIANMLSVDTTTVVSRFKKFNIQYTSFNIEVSKGQQQLYNFIKEHTDDVLMNDRTLIFPKEVDVLIPDKKLAIEYCGLYWHSECFIDKNYHLDKLQRVKAQGYELITLFEDEWETKRDIVKSMILHKIGKTHKKIYARNTYVKQLDNRDTKSFLDQNHIQGNINHTIALGLFDKEEDKLLSIMTFLSDGNSSYILNRFCSKINHSIIGSAGKLLKTFSKMRKGVTVKTFSDSRWSDGKLYETLKFEDTGYLPPDYFYIHNNNRFHKFLYRKQKMKQKLKLFEENKSEHENALSNGIFRIYDCGKRKFTIQL